MIRDTVPSTTAPTSRSAILAPFHSPRGRFPHPGRLANGHYPTPFIGASSTPREVKAGRRTCPSRCGPSGPRPPLLLFENDGDDGDGGFGIWDAVASGSWSPSGGGWQKCGGPLGTRGLWGGWGGDRRRGPARGAGGQVWEAGRSRSGSSLPPSHVLDLEVETSAVDSVLMHAQTLPMHVQTNAPALPGRLSRLSER